MSATVFRLPPMPPSLARAWEVRQAALEAWQKAPGEETRVELVAATRRLCVIGNLSAGETALVMEAIGGQMRRPGRRAA